ncbi:MAG: helicase RepA family protein, partial [Clostridiales bacterium]|nr:helicase RepA family protein [Clostridiales bacterium]
ICVLIVHHTRKMEASDSFDMIFGTNGLLGAADGAIILQKKKRVENIAKMMIVGRDQEDQELSLEFDREHCFWKLTKAEKELLKRTPGPIVITIVEFMKDRQEWTGTATDLLGLLPDLQIKPQSLTRKLNVNVSALYNDFNISYTQNSRSREKRTFTLKKLITDEEITASCDDIPVTLSGI